MMRSQAPNDPMALADMSRWAFFVTPKELNSLMDELEANESFKGIISPEHMKGIRAMEGLWNMNGVSIMPELRDIDEKLDG